MQKKKLFLRHTVEGSQLVLVPARRCNKEVVGIEM